VSSKEYHEESGYNLDLDLLSSILELYANVQWGTNQNVVFKIAVRKISRLPALKASRELKNWYFP
jgi:hypothetical protein